ncbi:redox-regulated ATPase YchF [Candidatus Gottesmanbacteria bacterium]|nr:redox-regulated ATPase YchF [Candidatus Gottesmanbacteria bacterium]
MSSVSVGIVGLPNVGKSTLFNALLKRQTAFVANYPFATIEPNIGVVPVPDPRLERLAKITKEEIKMDKLPPILPATVQFVDIAGLVSGAAEGEGLGNKFLSHIREVNIICHVVRFFEDTNIIHVSGSVDAKRDVEIIKAELILADLQTLSKNKDTKNKEVKFTPELVGKLINELDKGILAKDVNLTDEEKEAIKDLHLLTMKPVIYVANVAEGAIAKELQDTFGLKPIMSISAKIESELSSLSEEEQMAYLAELGMKEAGLDRLIRLAYESLGLISFLTCGEKEVRAWTIEKGMKAPQAAGVIHTDFEKGFIKSDTVSFDEFVKYGGWTKCREVGKVRMEGRDYIIRDGDVVEFKVNA